jgi:chromosome segregation ATPase
MANISRKNNKLNISSKDLKKAIVDRNNNLKKQNDKISLIVTDKEKELKSLENEYSSESEKLGKLIRDVEFQEGRLQKANGAVYSNEKLLSEKLKKVGDAEKRVCECEDTVEKLKDKEKELLDKIAGLEFYKSKCVDSKNELAGIQVKKDSVLDELVSVKNDISKALVEGKKKIAYYENQYDALEEKAKKHEDMVYQFEQRLIEAQDLFADEDNKLKDFLSKAEDERKKTQDELQAVKNLVGQSEDKYINWEQKVKKLSTKADKEEERIANAKKRYESWKIGVLEQVAKIKLKKKVENIDKAGLSEILNG